MLHEKNPISFDQYFTALPNYKAEYNYNRENETSTSSSSHFLASTGAWGIHETFGYTSVS
jgi:hypothetical protein